MAKKKEKILTPEELKEKIKKEKADFWIHCEPQLALIQSKEGAKIFPISETVEKQIIILFLLEAVDYVTDRVLELIDTWKKKYPAMGWFPLIVFQQKYAFITHKRFLDRFKGFHCFETLPLYLDTFGELHEWGGAREKPQLLILKQNNLIFKTALLPDFENSVSLAEQQLQDVLRIEDPGLPLPLLKPYQMKGLIDKKTLSAHDITLGGQWIEGKGTFMTDDIRASLSFPFQGKSLRFVSTLHPQARDSGRIVIRFNELPIAERFCGRSIKNDEKRNTVIEVNNSQGVYDIFKSDDEQQGVIEFSFKNAFESPIIFHELKIA